MNRKRRSWIRLQVALLGGLVLSCLVHAQPTGSDPIKIILPYPPGGSTDGIVRHIADRLSSALKQSVIVDNRPGAAGMIGAAAVASSPPDGRTLLFTNTALIQSPLIQPKPLYNPITDFEPVSLVAAAAQVFVVNESMPVKNLHEYVDYAKKHPGTAYGSLGVGSTGHLYGELLKRKAGVDIVHVAYKGDAPAITDLIGKQLPAGFVSTQVARTYGNAGRIKVLATLGSARVPSMPDVPTFAESGFDGFEAIGWIGMLAPAKTPKPVVEKLSAEISKIVRSPEGTKMLTEYGMLAQGSTAAEFSALIKRDQQVWQALVKQTNIRAE